MPALWANVAYPSLKPLGSWVVDLLRRLAFLQTWLDEGPPPSFWVSGFFFTQSFLTGTLQNVARQQAVPIDMLTFDFQMMNESFTATQSAQEGCYIHGLFIEGCRWDGALQALTESEPKVLFSSMPTIWLKVTLSSTIELLPNGKRVGYYESPVYRTAERRGTLSTTGHSTNFVMEMWLPAKLPEAHWVKRGVALLCALSD